MRREHSQSERIVKMPRGGDNKGNKNSGVIMRASAASKTASVGFLAAAVLTGTAACRTRSQVGLGARSILASIDGVDPSDLDLPGLSYKLICDRGNTVIGRPAAATPGATPGGSSGTSAGNRVSFPGESIQDGDVCALEVRAEIPPESAAFFKWLSKPADQAVGLLYGSSKGRVQAVDKTRKLALTIYKLYARTGGDTFAAMVDVVFKPNEGSLSPSSSSTSTNAPMLPDPSRMTASMHCLAGNFATDQYRQGGTADVGTFQFAIETTRAMGTSCDRLTVLQDNVAVFEGNLDPSILNFSSPARAEVIRFPRQFDLFPVGVEDAQGNGQTNGPAECMNYDGARQKCLDRRNFDLPNSKNYWVAKVQGRRPDGSADTLFVTSGNYGFNLDEGTRSKTTDDMTAALSSASPFAQRQKYNWYSSALDGILLDYEFDQAFTGGAYHASFSVNRVSIADFKVLHVDRVWTHGFHEVVESELEGQFMARWLALVGMTNGGSRVEFVVSGPRDYFQSQSKAAGSSVLPRYFTWDAFKSDRNRTETVGNQADFAAYALTTTTFAPASCSMSLSALVERASAMTSTVIDASGGVRDGVFESCRISKVSFPRSYDNWTPSVRFFLWGWKAIL